MLIRSTAFTLLAACSTPSTAPTAAPAPCPPQQEITKSECPEPEVAERKCRPCPRVARGLREVAPVTCAFGEVETAGDMVMQVQRALVELRHGDKKLTETWSDDAGRFVACIPSELVAAKEEITVRVSKPPFETAAQTRSWSQGQHESYTFALHAEGLTN